MNDKTLRGSGEPSGGRAASLLRASAGILVALVLLWFFLSGVDWPRLRSALATARIPFLVVSTCLTVVMYGIRAWRWRNLLLPLQRVPVFRLFSITLVGFMAGLVVPRAQEGLRPYLVGRAYGIRPSAAFASIVLERLLDFLTVLVLFGLYLLLPSSGGDGEGVVGRLKVGGEIAAFCSVLGAAALFVFHLKTEATMDLADRVLLLLPFGVGRFLSSFLRSFGEGLAVLRAPAGHLIGLGAQSLLLWLTIDLTVFLNNKAFGLALPFPSSFMIVAVLLIGVSIPTPGMVGGYHEAYRVALTKVYGVDASTAVAAAITGHALSNLPVLVLGLLFLRREGLAFGSVRGIAREVPAEADPQGKERSS
jgi:uncharacterized protein (TIRG00374 family)